MVHVRITVRKILRNKNVQKGFMIYLTCFACMVLFPLSLLEMNFFRPHNILQRQHILEVGILNTAEISEYDVVLMLQKEPGMVKNGSAKHNPKEPCPFPPKNMKGRDKEKYEIKNIADLEQITDMEIGGRYIPPDCKPVARVAIIIPYRDREKHLITLLYYLIPKLKRQKLDFTFYVIEQTTSSSFNRGMIRNIGFVEASKQANYDCYIFNDVDTLMEDDRNMYLCNKRAIRHLVTGVDRFDYELIYDFLIGGVISFTKEQFIAVNGYSNRFFVWGGEDDDLYKRIKCLKMKLDRPVNEVGLFTTLKHVDDPKLHKRFIVYGKGFNLYKTDGLNSLKYKRLKLEYRKYFTWVYVDINEKDVLQDEIIS